MNLSYIFTNLFLPRESNNHKARLLHSSTLFLIAFFLIFYQLVLFLLPKSGVNILGYASNISIDEVIKLTNDKRMESGLPPLENNPQLSLAAKTKGEDMLADDYWAHVAPDGTEPWKFFTDAGYKYRYAGENLARDFSNTNSAIDAWMASPTHKENMLSSKYKEIGIAVVEGDLAGVDTTIIVQLFGTRYADTTPASPIAKNNISETEAAPLSQATSLATQIPVALTTATPIVQQPVLVQAPVAGEGTEGNELVLVSPFNTTRGTSLLIVGILMLVLVIDAILVSRRRIARIGGRTFAHLSFLGMIVAIAIILRAGKIL